MQRSKKTAQGGISLVEILIVLATLGFLAVLISAIPNAVSSVTKSRYRSLAKDIVNRQVNSLRQTGYSNLANGSASFTDNELNRLPFAQGNFEVDNCPSDICTNNEQAKKVKVVVSWRDGSATESAEVVSIIGQGGIGQ